MAVLGTTITLFVGYILWQVIKRTLWAIRAAKLTSNIPCPKAWPIIGSAQLFMGVKTQKDLFDIFAKLYQDYRISIGKIGKIWVGPNLFIILASHKHIETILSHPYSLDKDAIYQYFEQITNGVIVKNGAEWSELRKPLNQLLTPKMIQSNVKVFHDKALKLCKVWMKFAENGENFDVKHYVMNFAIDTFSVSNMGYDLNEIENNKYNLSATIDESFEIIYKMVAKIPYNFSLLYAKLSSGGRRLRKLGSVFWNLSDEILTARMASKKVDGGDNEKPKFYSDVIIRKMQRDKLTWEVTGKITTDFILAGSDTSTVISSSIILLLAMFPEHQEAVYREQVEVLGVDPEITPTWEQLSNMHYLTRVVKEAKRIFSINVILRKVANDINLGDYKLPKGSIAYISLKSLHMDPDNWSHPHEFYPDHFLPEEVAKRPKGAYLPFSAGPRICPGIQYAMASIKTFISTIIRKYKFETDLKYNELTYKFSLMVEINEGYKVRIRPRNC